jgi:hypothetical protein
MELELELVGEEDLDETLKFNDMAARLRRMCDQELGALDQRAAVLLGDANLQAEQNPFGTQAICGAYKGVCKGIESDVAIRRALLRVFDDHFADKVRGAYKEVNELLVENSILPKIKYAVKKTEGGGAAARTAARKATTSRRRRGQGQEGDRRRGRCRAGHLPDPRQAGRSPDRPGRRPAPGDSGRPAGARGDGAALARSPAAARQRRGDHQWRDRDPAGRPRRGQRPAQLKETNVGASLGQMDAMTLGHRVDAVRPDLRRPQGPRGREGAGRPPPDPDAEDRHRGQDHLLEEGPPARGCCWT